MKIKTMIRSCVRCGFAATMISLLFTSCRDTISDGGGTTGLNELKDAISFNTTVLSSHKASRADGSIVNWKQTSLPQSVAHDYYRVDENGVVQKESKTFYAGLFACYTGPKTWEQLVVMSLKPSPTAAEQDTLNMYYSANQMYNVPANIGAAVSGANSLTYTPYLLWPNDGKYMTFFGYYPYNPTSAQGDYGIAIVNDENGVGEGKGMGKVHFTMHPDASLQNDFLISAPATNCIRDDYPLQVNSDGTYSPKPVRLNFYHMLAQVRIYAYVRGDDKMVYVDDNSDGKPDVADATWFDAWDVNRTIKDAWGNIYTKVYANGTDDSEGYAVERTTQKAAFPTEFADNLTKEQFLALELKVPDESQCIRWARGTNWDVTHSRRRAAIDYSMEVNNIKTEASFYPDYTNPSGATIGCTPATTLGYATINHYIMNPYWFTFKDNKRSRLNDNYMFGYYEDTPAHERLNASTTMVGYDDIDGMDWSNTTKWGSVESNKDPMGYLTGKDEDHLNLIKVPDSDPARYYNFAPGNTILVVPQELSDDDVPHIVITAKGRNAEDTEDLTAKVTINMLKMGIKWESGFIYCYAFIDDLQPGDDKVRGPESITVVFDTSQYTDQW